MANATTGTASEARGLPLAGMRILDLCEEQRAYCGRLLCDLGAEVLKLERPQGDPGRRAAPLIPRSGSEPSSLSFLFFNAGKRSAVADPRATDSLCDVESFIGECDAIVEDVEPGSDREPLREALRERVAQRQVVWTSLTAWGRSGPLSGAPASDVALLAHSGFLSLGGRPDREPLSAHGGLSWLALGAFGAMATLGALYRRAMGGPGSVIDASAIEAMAHSLENAPQFVDLEGIVRGRTGHRTEAATGVFRCADGFVYLFTAMGGTLFGWEPMVRWLEEAGTPGASGLRHDCWRDMAWRKTAEAAAAFEPIFCAFTATRTRQTLFEEGQHRGVIIGAVHTPRSLLDDPSLRERAFFHRMPLEQGDIQFPGSPYRFRSVDIRARGPSPHLGEFTSARNS